MICQHFYRCASVAVVTVIVPTRWRLIAFAKGLSLYIFQRIHSNRLRDHSFVKCRIPNNITTFHYQMNTLVKIAGAAATLFSVEILMCVIDMALCSFRFRFWILVLRSLHDNDLWEQSALRV